MNLSSDFPSELGSHSSLRSSVYTLGGIQKAWQEF